VPGSLVESTGYGRNWSFAERTISAPITPMKSERWEPNWSFANPQGSWFNGAGSRNGSGGNGVCVARRSIRQAMTYPGFRRRQLAWVFCRRAVWHSGFPQACWRLPTRAFGRNQRRQIAHGLFRASGMVMLHGHHAAARTVGGQIRMTGSVLESRGCMRSPGICGVPQAEIRFP
jgi:hypothetical protein